MCRVRGRDAYRSDAVECTGKRRYGHAADATEIQKEESRSVLVQIPLDAEAEAGGGESTVSRIQRLFDRRSPTPCRRSSSTVMLFGPE